MIRNLKILIFLCTVTLCCAIPATLWLAILGRFTMMFATAVAALLLIAMLIVLSRDLRVQKLMGGGISEQEDGPTTIDGTDGTDRVRSL